MFARLLQVRNIHVHDFFQSAVVLAVMALSAFLGYRTFPRLLTLLVVAIGSVAGAVYLIRKPDLGPLILLVAALIIPFEIGTGTQTTLNAAILIVPVLLVLWLVKMIRYQEISLVPTSINLPLLLFVTSATLSFITGNILWNYFANKASFFAQLGGWMIFVLSAGAFLLVANQVKSLRWLKILTTLFLILGGLYIAGRLIPTLQWFARGLIQRDATGSLFWVWLVSLAGGQAIFRRDLGGRERLVLIGLVAATLWAGWRNRDWASGWTPPLVAVMTLLWLRSWKLGLLTTLVGFLGIALLSPELLNNLIIADQYSIDTRFIAWKMIFEQVVSINPLLGLGPANYYHYTPLIPILGWYVQFNSHNQYIDILAQTGIIGMVCFGWLMAAIGRLGWRLRERVGDGFRRGYVYGCLAGLAGTLASGMIVDWFLPFVYNVGLAGFRASVLGWIFLGGLVVVEQTRNSNVEDLEG